MLWQAVSLAAFAWACMTVLRLAGRRPSRSETAAVVAAGFLLEPVWHSMFLGQVNLVLLALVLNDLRRLSEGKRAGIGLGIAVAVKLTPALFVVVLLAAGRVRAAVTATAVFAACTAFGWLLAPGDSLTYWLDVFHDTSRVGVPYIANQSPTAAATRILGGADAVPSWFVVVSVVVACCGVYAAACRVRSADWLGVAAVCGTAMLLVSPVSWTHHWVWALPALALLVREGRRKAAAAGAALLTVTPPWWTPRDGGPDEYGFHGLTTLAANAYLVAGTVFLGWAFATARQNAAERPAAARTAGKPVRTATRTAVGGASR